MLLGRSLVSREKFAAESWALAAGVLGFILTVTGAHMTLTWPFAKYFPFDNIIFGETSLGLGVLLLAAAFYLWKRSALIESSDDPGALLARVAKPLGVFVFGLGLALFAIAAAGIIFQLFAAPPEEPISGAFAGLPVGRGDLHVRPVRSRGPRCRVVPLHAQRLLVARQSGRHAGHRRRSPGGSRASCSCCFGALNFFTHIGLIVNTMG